MRIGDYSGNKNMTTVSTGESTAVSSSPAAEPVNLKAGDVVEGKVVSRGEDGSVTLKTDSGKEVQVKVLSGEASQLESGKRVQIQLEDVTSSVKTGRLISNSGTPDTSAVDTTVDKVLKAFGEATGDAQKNVVKAMMQFDVPMTKENFKAIQNDSKYAQKLAEVLQNNPSAAEHLDVTEEIKNILVKLISSATGSKQPATPNQQVAVDSMGQPAVQNTTKVLDQGVQEEVTAASGDVDTLEAGLEVEEGEGVLRGASKSIGNTPLKGQGALENQISGQNQALGKTGELGTELGLGGQLKVNTSSSASQSQSPNLGVAPNASSEFPELVVNEKTVNAKAAVVVEMSDTVQQAELKDKQPLLVKAEVLQSLQDHTPDKTAFFKKMAIDGTLSNIVAFNRLLINKQSMMGAFEKILVSMDQKGMTSNADIRNLLLKLTELEQTDLDGHIDVLKQLSDRVAEMKETSLGRMERLSDQVTQLKNDFDFIKNMNDNLVYYQMPLKYEEGTGQLEIAYKKRKKDPSEGHRIFISLDTIHIGRVQAMVELKGRTVKIGFKVDDELRERFEASFEGLQKAVDAVVNPVEDGLGSVPDPAFESHVEIGFIERKEPLSAMDLFRNEVPSLSAFEMSI